MAAPFKKDPDDVLDYRVPWNEDPTWVNGDTIIASTFTVEPVDVDDLTPLVVDSSSFTTLVTTVWVSGGTDLHKYTVVNHITTAGGRQMDKPLYFTLTQKAR